MRLPVFTYCLFATLPCLSQDIDTTVHKPVPPDSIRFIKVHFLYGSKPARGYKKTEAKWFGGIHGGHVSIEIDSQEIGFAPYADFHVFAHKKNITGKFVATPITEWLNDTSNSGHQYLTITIPVSDAQYDLLSSIHKQYVQQSPYDYAFIGMRCANATYDILSKGGFFPVYSRSKNIRKHFYPKPLRKKMVRWAKQHNYPMVFHQGSDRRKWEKD